MEYNICRKEIFMKCYVCNQECELSELSNIHGKYGTCDKCKHYEPPQKRKRMAITTYKLEHGCQNCGYNKCADALQLHHKDPKTKTDALSRMVMQGYSLDRIMQEANKCIVLCANCHAELHAQWRSTG